MTVGTGAVSHTVAKNKFESHPCRLAVGKKADLNVIDYRAMRLHIPEVRYDLPMNGRRLVQRVDGYRNTFVSGVQTFEDGAFTGATPGRLVRACAV